MKQNYLEPSRTDFSLSLLKKWLFRCWSIIMVVLLGIIIVPNSYGQTIVTEGSTVKAWFGIDADIYSNILTVDDEGFASPEWTDDWFKNEDFPGSIRGLGVIDQTDAGYWTSRVLSNYNTSFELRMSSDPDRNWEDPESGMLWIDAVYFRDNNSQGAFKDSTVFTAGSDANGANPSSWSLGIGGTPQKNDLVDVMGHMRKDENGDLYGIGAFTTISSDGNSHGDFEFFQSQVDLFEGALTNLGPDAGHTAWEFSQYAEGDVDSEGNPAIPGHYYISKVGDLIVSIDFENGGTEPQASVRLWMSDATFAGLNGMPSIPGLGFTLSGEFNSGEDATGFGYAGIVTPSTTYTIAWAVVNVDQNVLGAPWGSLEDKALYDSIQALQYAEFAINLTDLGIGDNFGGEDPCNQTLGSLMVKTRASSSFTAELKDFGGPFLFGVEYTTDIAVQDLKTCVTEAESYAINLNAGVTEEFGGLISFFENAADTSNLASAIPNPTEFPVLADDMPKTIYARSTNTDDPSKLCYAVDSFVIDYWPEPLCDFPEEDVNYHNVTLVGGNDGWAEPQIDGGTGPFTYLWSVLPGDPEGFIPEGEEDDLRADGLTAGAYRLDIEDANGCTTWCEILISEPDAACDVTLDGAEICCPDVPVTLCATAAEGTIYSELTIFSWYTGETFDAATLYAENTGADPCQEFIVSEETTVWLVVNNQGCISEPQSAVITIDNTPLVDPVDGGETIECADDLNTPTPPAVYDNCGELIDPGEPAISPTPDCVGDVTYTWTYTDCLDREVQYIYTFTILPPVVNIPDDGGMEVACPADILAPAAPELYDNCGRMLTFIGMNDPDTEVCNEDVVFIYTYTDCLQREYTWKYTFVVKDDIPPVITIDPYDETLCNMDVPEMLTANWTDNCAEGDMLTAYAQMYMANDCDTTYFYAFEAMDDCENVSKDTAFITKESMVYDNCETAFAYYSEEISTCFIDDPDYKFNRWGWTNAISEGSYEMPLYAGAAHCELGKGLEVGTVMVDYTGGSLSVEYVLFEGYVMNEAHVYVGCEPYPMKNGKATVAPGQFTYTASDLQNSGGVAINFNEVSGEMIYVIAHAVTCEVVCACSDYEGPHDGDPLIYQGVPIVCEEALEANTVDDETTGDNSKENKGKAKGNNKNITTDIAVFNLSDLKVYPNPFDDKVNIQFMTEKGGHAVLEIHNMLGQRVVRLLDKQVEAGELQRVEFKPETEISGMYLYRLDIDGDVRIGKLIYRNR